MPSISATDSLSLTGASLDTELSSTLRGLGAVNSALDSYLGAWVSIDDLADYHGSEALGPVFPATGLVVQAGEDPDAWVLIPEGETSPQALADLESSSWVLLDDLVCDLTEDTFVPIQSIFVHQPDESSNPAVYVCLADPDSTLGGLSLNHTLDSFLYTDIAGVSPGPGNDWDTAASPENPDSDLFLNTSTQVGSEAGPLPPCDDLKLDAKILADDTPHLSTSTSSSLDSSADLVGSLLDSSVDLDIASDPGSASPSNVGPSVCPCGKKGN